MELLKGKAVWLIVVFFVLMSLLTPYAKSSGIDASGLFFAVVGSAGATLLLYLVIRWSRSRLHRLTMSRGQMAAYLFTPQPTILLNSIPTTDVSLLSLPSPYEDGSSDEDEADYSEWEPMNPPYEDDADVADVEEQEEQEDELSGQPCWSLIEQDSINLADNFQPSVNPLLSECTTIIGIRRSGKSNAIAVLSEELAPWGVPLVLADTEDEYSELSNHKWMPRGRTAGSPALLEENPELSNFTAVNIAGAYNFGQYVLDNGLQIVLNLKSYEDDEAALLMVELINGMNDWQEARANKNRVSCMLILDESQKWLPQDLSQSCLTREPQKLLQRAIFDTMVNRGGKRGLGLILGAQKPAQLDKRALQSKWKFLFRQTERIELKEYAWMGVDEDAARSLKNGECFLFSPGVSGQSFQMRKRYSPDNSTTPGLSSVLSHRKTLRSIDRLEEQSFVVQLAPITEQSSLSVAIATAVPTTTTTTARRNSDQLQEALEAWNAGADSVRKLSAALRVTQYQAGELRKRLIEQQMISV